MANHTQWCVFTGAPCSGKTTLLNLLRQQGHHCVPEAARMYIDGELAKGLTLAEIRKDEGLFQRAIVDLKLGAEQQLHPGQLTFLDRGMPDSITYYRIAGLDPARVHRDCLHFRYRRVFLFDRLPLEIDNVRNEDDETAARIDQWLESDYLALGYDVIRVPVLPIAERLDWIVGCLAAE